jgi:hypothetical protein
VLILELTMYLYGLSVCTTAGVSVAKAGASAGTWIVTLNPLEGNSRLDGPSTTANTSSVAVRDEFAILQCRVSPAT